MFANGTRLLPTIEALDRGGLHQAHELAASCGASRRRQAYKPPAVNDGNSTSLSGIVALQTDLQCNLSVCFPPLSRINRAHNPQSDSAALQLLISRETGEVRSSTNLGVTALFRTYLRSSPNLKRLPKPGTSHINLLYSHLMEVPRGTNLYMHDRLPLFSRRSVGSTTIAAPGAPR